MSSNLQTTRVGISEPSQWNSPLAASFFLSSESRCLVIRGSFGTGPLRFAKSNPNPHDAHGFVFSAVIQRTSFRKSTSRVKRR
jgi:hypothetical protein